MVFDIDYSMALKRKLNGVTEPQSLKQTKLAFFTKLPQQKLSTGETRHHADQKVIADESMAETAEPVANNPGIDSNQQASTSSAMPPTEEIPKTVAESSEKTVTRQEGSILITEKIGDLFDAPDNSILIHACNCRGHWGSGIAAAFRRRYPMAYKKHRLYCGSARNTDDLLGTAQLIAPCEKRGGKKHYVACLFTSCRFGLAKDSPSDILAATEPAMKDLMAQISKLGPQGMPVSEVRMCHINSGLFNVPWKETKELIEGIQLDGQNVHAVAWDL